MNKWAYSFLEELFEAFKENQLNAVLMRSYDWLNDEPIGDIDLLISPDALRAIKNVLDEFARENNWSKIFEDKDANHAHFIYAKEDNKHIKYVHIDLQTFLGRKGFFYCPSDKFMENPKLSGSIPILNDSNSISSLILHVILDKKFVKEQYGDKIIAFDSIELARNLEDKIGEKLTKSIIEWKKKGLPNSDVAAIEKRIRKHLLFKYPKNIFIPLLHKIYRVSRYFMNNRGILIAALGPDGAGKSTALEHIQKILSSGDIQVATVYMGKRDTLLPTSKLIRMYYNYKDKNIEGHVAASKKSSNPLPGKAYRHVFKSTLIFLKEVLGLLNWFAEQWARYLFQIRPILQQGGVVLCDRYAYDLANRPRNSIVYKRPFIWLLKIIYPTPHIIYFFWEAPEILYKRKMENTIEQNISLINNYRSLLNTMPNYKEIRTNTDANTISFNASKDILRLMQRE